MPDEKKKAPVKKAAAYSKLEDGAIIMGKLMGRGWPEISNNLAKGFGTDRTPAAIGVHWHQVILREYPEVASRCGASPPVKQESKQTTKKPRKTGKSAKGKKDVPTETGRNNSEAFNSHVDMDTQGSRLTGESQNEAPPLKEEMHQGAAHETDATTIDSRNGPSEDTHNDNINVHESDHHPAEPMNGEQHIATPFQVQAVDPAPHINNHGKRVSPANTAPIRHSKRQAAIAGNQRRLDNLKRFDEAALLVDDSSEYDG
ncbi:uncharacterized protein EV422DRAFT_114118 [Fimicolochytrium jonesii]|uniref:uncharacterized protein n=1 Tax=Fimicolochytrium jonesii TaxID=1396493 RepID=UPI0022FDBCE1|nr:uncharacterized protein EV422DRAFT_114118 [Fimicolochytrium jonesii]KAI8819468.1 hypothetical protein EV422DRAFT_114118 [Fimicolochytrium jonesii]